MNIKIGTKKEIKRIGDIMWILPKQLHTSASVLGIVESDSDLREFCQVCEKSLTWRSKPSQWRTWCRRWNRNKFMQLLYTRTLRPSHTKSFVEEWTSCREDSLASRLAPQEIDKVLKTLVTSTPTSVEESESANLELFSSKTLKESSQAKQQTENQFSSMSLVTWKKWVTEQRQEYSQRLKLAHHTRENESSSWGTPNTRDYKDTMNTVPPSIGKTRGLSLGQGVAAELQKNWATPITGDAHLASNPEVAQKRLAEGKSTLSRQMAAQNWATPNTMDTLPARSPEKLAEAKKKGGCKNLREEVMKYPTPTARDWKGCGNATTRKDGKHRMDNLEAIVKYGPQDPTNNNTNGKNHALNPSWVEQLMGLPVGWTDLDSWVTESCHLPQPEHSKY